MKTIKSTLGAALPIMAGVILANLVMTTRVYTSVSRSVGRTV